MTDPKDLKSIEGATLAAAPHTPQARPGQAVMSVRRALDEALRLYGERKFDAAASLVTQVAAARPRLAEAQNVMGVILSAQGKLAEAAKAFARATRIEPLNAQFFSNLGETERQRGKLQEAGVALAEAVRLDPDNPHALNNLGILQFDRKAFDAAASCYARALQKLPNYPEAHNNIGNALRHLGRLDEAIDHYQSALLLREAYPEAYNNMASVLRELGQVAEAEHAYRKAIALQPAYIDAYVNLSTLLDATERSDEALRLLGEALRINVHHLGALLQVANIQLRKMNLGQAEQAARLALSIAPAYADAHAVLGQILHEADRIDQAALHLASALKLNPALTEVRSLHAICLKSLGRTGEAKAEFEKTLSLAPAAYGVYPNLAEVERFTPGNPHLRSMENILAAAADPKAEQLMPLHFALGKAYGDIGDYHKAFHHISTGAALKRSRISYDEAQALDFFDAVRDVFTESLVRNSPFSGDATDTPVFIVGMPRSGSTLVEQVLSSHPVVHGAGETKAFSRQLTLLRSRFPGLPKYPQMVQKMTPAHFAVLADGYLAGLAALAPKAQRITDKLLSNFYFVGLLHMLYPNARFIHTRRNPMDTCLSIYTKLFKDEMPFSYELGELGRYYRKYEELMVHWSRVLPLGVMKTVDYEHAVSDLEAVARDAVAFLGLPWDDACLNFHESTRPVKTASVMQVREPVYASAVGRWKNYEEALEPLIVALGSRT